MPRICASAPTSSRRMSSPTASSGTRSAICSAISPITEPSLAVAYDDMPELERYMLARLAELDVIVRAGYDDVRLQARLPRAAQFLRQRSLRLLFRHPQGRALLRSLRQPRAARSTDRARSAVRRSHRLACADALLHHGGGLAQPLPRRQGLGASSPVPGRSPASGATRRSPRNGARCGRSAAW